MLECSEGGSDGVCVTLPLGEDCGRVTPGDKGCRGKRLSRERFDRIDRGRSSAELPSTEGLLSKVEINDVREVVLRELLLRNDVCRGSSNEVPLKKDAREECCEEWREGSSKELLDDCAPSCLRRAILSLRTSCSSGAASGAAL
jgi:hypothetical protein